MGFTIKSTGFDEVEKAFAPLKGAEDSLVEAQAPHAAAVEYGTSKAPAQPYASPGTAKALSHFDQLEAKAKNLQDLVTLIADAIGAEWRKIVPVDTGELRDSVEVQHG